MAIFPCQPARPFVTAKNLDPRGYGQQLKKVLGTNLGAGATAGTFNRINMNDTVAQAEGAEGTCGDTVAKTETSVCT